MKYCVILLIWLTSLTALAEESATKDIYIDAFSEIYKLGLNELAAEEKKAREESRVHVPFIYKSEKGKYSGSNSLSLLYSYDYDESKNMGTYSLPLSLLAWGSSDQVNYVGSIPLFTFGFSVGIEEKSLSGFASLPLLSSTVRKESDTELTSESVFLGPLYSDKYFEDKKKKTSTSKTEFVDILNKSLLSTKSTKVDAGTQDETYILGSLINLYDGVAWNGSEFNLLYANHDKGNDNHLTIAPLMTRFITDESGDVRAEFDPTKLWPIYYKEEYKENYDFLWPLSSMKFSEDDGLTDFESIGGWLTEYEKNENFTSFSLLSFIYDFEETTKPEFYQKDVSLWPLFSYDYKDGMLSQKDDHKIIFGAGLTGSLHVEVNKINKKKIKQKSKDLDFGLGIVYSSKEVNDGERYKNSSLLGLLHSYKYNDPKSKTKNQQELKLAAGFLYSSKGIDEESYENSTLAGFLHSYKYNCPKSKSKNQQELKLAAGLLYSSKDVNDGESYENKSLAGFLHSYKYNCPKNKTKNEQELKLAAGFLYSSKDTNNGEKYKSSSLLGLLHSHEYNKKDDYSYKRFTPFFAVEKKGKEKHFRFLHFIKIPLGSE